MPDVTDVARFYDKFSGRLIRDIVYGNRRVDPIRCFLRMAIHPDTARILEIGCGSGANAAFLRKLAPHATIDTIDLSPANIEIAKALFGGRGITFRHADALELSVGDRPYDVIVLPDVYEHIPRDQRGRLNRKLGELLADEGKILMTFPAPGYFPWMRENGHPLQIIDESITMDDLLEIGKAVNGVISYYRMVSVGLTNEYAHAIVERGADRCRRVGRRDMLAVKMARRNTLAIRLWRRLRALPRMAWVYRKTRELRAKGVVAKVPWGDHSFFR